MQITPEEIAQYRQQFAESPEALDALDLIAESDGDLNESASLLALENGVSVTRTKPDILDEFAEKCRPIVCTDEFIDDLMGGLLTAAVVSLATTGQIPAAVATPVVIYLAKTGVKRWCNANTSTNP